MRIAPLAFTLATVALAAPAFVAVDASYVPAGGREPDAAIAVTFSPTEPQIVINETPAPRLALDPEQTILVDKQAPRPAGAAAPDPEHAKYLDPSEAVRFPVAIAAGVPKGTHTVKATVTYYFCSKREGWCRKGTANVAVAVKVE